MKWFGSRTRVGLQELEGRYAPAAGLLKDINTSIDDGVPTEFVPIGTVTYFAASTPTLGRELWKTDGTTIGTVPVKDIRPGRLGSDPENLIAVNGLLYFTADDGAHGRELWKSDGTATGTVLVEDIHPGVGAPSTDPDSLTAVGTTLFFTADDGIHGRELWKSNGTIAGTALVKDIAATTFSAFVSESGYELLGVNSTLFFTANNGDGLNGMELYKSDGTEAGTVLVKDIYLAGSSSPRELTDVNGTLFFSAFDSSGGRELWKSNGTAAGTVLVKDIFPGSSGSFPHHLTNVNGTLFFAANDGVSNQELWKCNGTASGTVLVKDIYPGGGFLQGSNPDNLINVNGLLYFNANDPVNGAELWKSNGTAAGTVLVKDINPGSKSSEPFQFTNVNGTLFFVANDGVHYFEVWTSNGTDSGTTLVKDFPEFDVTVPPFGLSNGNGTLFFTANDGVHGWELWKSNGTTVGTVLVKDMAPGTMGSNPSDLTNVNGPLFFSVADPVNGTELWKSDGTAAGTVLVKDIRPGVDGSNPRNLTNVNGTLFFTADDGTHGRELWKSDGTAAGTVLVKDIHTGSTGSFLSDLTDVNGTLYFTVDDPVNGNELWKSNGTAAGTVLVKDIRPGAGSSFPSGLTNVNGTLYLSADDGTNGPELWKSNGTAAGTVMVKDIRPGSFGSNPTHLRAANGALYFDASDGVTGYVLWRSDGTAAGTVRVTDLAGILGSYLIDMTNVNGTYFFPFDDGNGGSELWKTDGTLGGTAIVRDIRPGSVGSDPRDLTNVNGMLYFTADDGAHGRELWRSDGTAAGTVLGADLAPGTTSSELGELLALGNRLYFVANTDSYSTEVWFVERNRPPTDLGLTNTVIAENLPTGTPVGTFATADPDSGDTFTYSLVAGVGDTGNGAFTLVGNELRTAAGFNFEAQNTYSIRVRTTDAEGLSFEKVFTIAVGNASEPPTDLGLSGTAVAENLLAGTVVGAFAAADPDAGDTFTYSLVAGAGDGGNGAFTIVGNELRTTAAFDFEAQSTYSVRVRVTDASGLSFEKVFTIGVTDVGEVRPGGQFMVGADLGGEVVRVFNRDRTERFQIAPFPGFTGGVRTAGADFNADGIFDLIAGTGPGRSTRVRILDGATQAELFAIDPFEAAFTGGVYVAAGDVNGDGTPDLLITPDEGGGPRVRIFSGKGFTQLADFFGIDDVSFRGGARATVGDITGDGRGEVIVSAGFGGGPRITIWDGAAVAASGSPSGGAALANFFAFETALRNGCFVAAGDFDGDGKADVAFGGGPGGGPRVRVFDGPGVVAAHGTFTNLDELAGLQRANFFAGDTANRGGIRLAVADIDADTRADLITGSGRGGGSQVTAYPGGSSATDLFSFDAFPGSTAGVFVG